MNAKIIIKNVLMRKIKSIISIFFFMLLSVVLKISLALIFYHVINKIILENDLNQSRILFSVSMTILCAFGILLFELLRMKKTLALGNDITLALSTSAHSNLLRSDILEFKKLQKEDIFHKITVKSRIIGQNYFVDSVLLVLYNSILFSGILITLTILNPWFSLYVIISLPIYYFITKQIKKWIAKREIINQQINDQFSHNLYHNIENVKHIKLLNAIKVEEENYKNLLDNLNKSHQKNFLISFFNHQVLVKLVINLLFAAVIGFGSWMILGSGSTSLGDIVVMFLLSPMLFSAFKTIIDTKIMPRHYHEHFDEINEIIQLRAENRAFTVQRLDEIYSFKFKDVYYDYGKDSDFLLKDINFELKKGEKLGILGLAKSGKTTIADLISKVIRPRHGSITINNCDINRVDTYFLRDLIAIVPQKYKLTKEKLVDNIIYPYPFDDYKYNDALNKCRLKQLIISLPQKDQTRIEDIDLSEADKQRIVLANAFYKDAKIYVFDEVTSKMDQNLEKEMMEAIYRLKNKIIIIISNRIYNLINCDKILILNNGKIVEYGKTSDLLNDKKSTFAKMLKDSQATLVKKTAD